MVGRREHLVAGARVIVPARIGLEVHRAQLPLAQRIVDPRHEAPLLLVLADLEPELDQDDPGIDEPLLELGQFSRKFLTFLLACRSPSHARRRRDCTSCGRRSRFRRPPGNARCSAADRAASSRRSSGALSATTRKVRGLTRSVIALIEAALAGGIAPLEDDDDPCAGCAHPVLQVAELDLKLLQLLLIVTGLHLGGLFVATILGMVSAHVTRLSVCAAAAASWLRPERRASLPGHIERRELRRRRRGYSKTGWKRGGYPVIH